jgi:hypothetical protein
MGCALILAALSSAACHVMRPITLAQLAVMKPDRAWVTASDKSVVVLTGPINVLGDTLVGYVNGAYEEILPGRLKQVIVQKPAPRRTAMLAVAIAVGIGGFAYALAGIGASPVQNPIAGDCDKHPGDPNYGC